MFRSEAKSIAGHFDVLRNFVAFYLRTHPKALNTDSILLTRRGTVPTALLNPKAMAASRITSPIRAGMMIEIPLSILQNLKRTNVGNSDF